MPYRTPFFRGPDLTEAPPTPWWHVWRCFRWSLVRRLRRDKARAARRTPRISHELETYLEMLGKWARRMGLQAHDLRKSWPRMIDAQNAYLNKRRPPPTDVPGPSRKVLL